MNFDLANILGNSSDQINDQHSIEMDDAQKMESPAPAGYCIECGDQPAMVHCEQCTDDYCYVCFASIHRKGTRKTHTQKTIHSVKHLNAAVGHDLQPHIQEDMRISETEKISLSTASLQSDPNYFLERAKYIPLRLTLEERKYLRLLEAALNVSEYTDKIDVIVYSSKTKRMVAQIRELCAILSG